MAAAVSVAVIVPALAPSPYLGEALDSVLDQHPAPAEIVVADDASPEPLALSAERVARCRVVRREVRGGPAATRATALEHTSAPLVALLDSDDVWTRGKLQVQTRSAERHGNVAVFFGRAEVVGPDGAPTGHRLEAASPGLIEAEEMRRVLVERNPIPTSSALIRREALEAAGGFPGAATDDWGCWMRLAEAGADFLYDPSVVVRYRRHPGGMTSDIASVAEQALALQSEHPQAGDPATRARARRDHLVLLARGRIRERRYAEARDALHRAGRAAPLRARERALGAVATVPGLRAALGRRSPYRT